jgi:hypothetical protein
VLPDQYHEGDRRWLLEQFEYLVMITNTRQAQAIAIKYAAVYEEAWQSEPVNVKKDGAARHEANTRLRKAIENVRGKVEAPPTT